MYEEMTYELILQRMLDRIADHIDKREGSISYNADAAAAVEMQLLYIALDVILNETFADTASRPYLIKRAAERGISPDAATKAVLKGVFNITVPIGSRYSLNNLNYIVTEPIDGEPGAFKVECEMPGTAGNREFGALIPIEYIDGLQSAQLTELLVPGEDEEGTEAFRSRYFGTLNAKAYGGNQADYKEKVNALPGVGGVKVYRVWNGDIRPADLVPPAELDAWLDTAADIPDEIRTWIQTAGAAGVDGKLTVGGTVRLVIIGADYAKPSQVLLDQVQAAVDPEQNHGEGLGIAPIGHVVTVAGVLPITVDIATNIVLQDDWAWEDVREYAEQAVDEYFRELATAWAESDNLIVRISQIETRFLNLPGVVDIADTMLNGATQNLILDPDSIPTRGEIDG